MQYLVLTLGILALSLGLFLLLLFFIWIGCFVMRVQATFMNLVWCALGGSISATAMLIATEKISVMAYMPTTRISIVFFVVALVIGQILWKTTRTDMIPDGMLVVIIGCGLGALVVIALAGKVSTYFDFNPVTDTAENQYGDPYYMQAAGKTYYMGDNGPYYLDEDGNKITPGMDANSNPAYEALVKQGESVEELEAVVGQAGSSPIAETAAEEEDSQVDQVTTDSSEAPADTAPSLPAWTQNADASAPAGASWDKPSRSDRIVRGQPLPFKIMIPAGWSVADAPNQMWLKRGGHVFMKCLNGDPGPDNKAYLAQELNRIRNMYGSYEVKDQQVVEIAGVSWARLTWQNEEGHQLVSLTHAGDRGCYTVEIQGTLEQIDMVKEDIGQMLRSVALPPHNFFVTED